MKRLLDEQRLGFVATVCPDGTPNLSPKGTTAVWDDDRLVFADIHSPGTIANLRHNPSVEVNVVDPFARTGYRFKGTAAVYTEGAEYDAGVAFYRERGSRAEIRAIVLIRIEQAAPLISPAYDDGTSESEIRRRWERHYAELHERWREHLGDPAEE
jgi:predicted pyridoxine 5'-phosphate oxidase superfamily flavin-nucleotide-binding protein